ncbi:MAG TPA: B12-binding domain-containing protein [Acidimicrobiales bacterium]|nr:B12-binding domain-containing protein [Acidimicrobiales bacterium]
MTVYGYVRTGRLPADRDGARWSVAIADLDRLRVPDARPPRSRASGQHRPKRLLDRMTAGDEAGAWSIVEEALSSGTTAPEVYVDVLLPALRAIGERWEQGRLSVADEHRASAVATRIVGRLGPMFARRGLSRGTIVLGAPEGDPHALPSAIVADLLRGRGFEALDLGANTPVTSFVESARAANRLVAVLVGASSKLSVARLAEIALALRAGAIAAPIYFGGGAVSSERVALDLGADGWSGVDADAVIAAVEDIAESSRHEER